ncbi:penicillin-binding protein 2 [Nakamurella antarctica]|uniref:Penicillin-binding protein 2 n=2 Tax=Nakamurella antarctica TaxID=1902245 RepID=A0A3G8ZZH7_9ACTN|nr:penicillin-binding protein 2 [Nakamurella antarctica]
MLVAAIVKLTFVQGVSAAEYAAKAESQRADKITLFADRGAIVDRNGTPLAFTVEGRMIAARPALFVSDVQRHQVADILVAALGPAVSADAIMEQLLSGKKYVYLAKNLMPAQTDAIMADIRTVTKDQVNAVVTERQDIRQYPDGGVARSIVGNTGWDGHGTMGIEVMYDSVLSGTDGSRVADVDARGGVIPGTNRDEVPAKNGTDINTTMDADFQYQVQQYVTDYVAATGAKKGMAVVMDVKTGQVYSLAYSVAGQDPAHSVSNPVMSETFEPGSVNKVVTFAAALEAGLITPESVLQVDGDIKMGGITVHDAWKHGEIDMTATGILAKSSNVGTLMIAQKVGEAAFADELKKFGLGKKTGIELPGEEKGIVPEEGDSRWSSTTFANLPIGQGLTMTLVQLASMYQAIGNGGVRIPPTVIAGTTTNGVFTPAVAKPGVPVMSPATADTLRDMLRATTQDGDISHKGTAAGAAITGYQVGGKTGTAQQVDPETNQYSATKYNSTFAGLVPADNPRFAVAIMLDAPTMGKNAVPLFKDIAAYAMRAFDVPPSATPAPVYDLYKNYGG